MIIWNSNGKFQAIRVVPAVLAGLAELVMSGYQRLPWGGVELGGVLFGRNDPDGISIHSFRHVDCDHANGPSFELADRDLDGFERLLANAASDGDLVGLGPVGWYHSVSRELALSPTDRALQDRFFPETLQLAMILKRSKKNPLEIGFYCRDSAGTLQAHSARREFAIENFRLHTSVMPASSVEISSEAEPLAESSAVPEPTPFSAKTNGSFHLPPLLFPR